MRKSLPQKEKVLNHLIKKGSLTQRQASRQLNVDRLSARINELRKIYTIYTDNVTRKVDGVRKTFARYVWGKKEAA
jgi:hypothetical protein